MKKDCIQTCNIRRLTPAYYTLYLWTENDELTGDVQWNELWNSDEDGPPFGKENVIWGTGYISHEDDTLFLSDWKGDSPSSYKKVSKSWYDETLPPYEETTYISEWSIHPESYYRADGKELTEIDQTNIHVLADKYKKKLEERSE